MHARAARGGVPADQELHRSGGRRRARRAGRSAARHPERAGRPAARLARPEPARAAGRRPRTGAATTCGARSSIRWPTSRCRGRPRPPAPMLAFVGALLGIALVALQGLVWLRSRRSGCTWRAWLPRCCWACVVGVPLAAARAAGRRSTTWTWCARRSRASRIASSCGWRSIAPEHSTGRGGAARSSIAWPPRIGATTWRPPTASSPRPLRAAATATLQRARAARVASRRLSILTTRELAGAVAPAARGGRRGAARAHHRQTLAAVALIGRRRLPHRRVRAPGSPGAGGVAGRRAAPAPAAGGQDASRQVDARCCAWRSTAMQAEPRRAVLLVDPHRDLAEAALGLVPDAARRRRGVSGRGRRGAAVRPEPARHRASAGTATGRWPTRWRSFSASGASGTGARAWRTRFALRCSACSTPTSRCAPPIRVGGRAAQHTLLEVPTILSDVGVPARRC